MDLLLDTHALLWWLDDDPRLGKKARAAIADPEATVAVSAATVWEVSIKVALGRLDLGEPPEIALPREFSRRGIGSIPVTMADALAVRALPRHHRDPFNRMLIAQARAHDLTLVSNDAIVRRYDAKVLRADR